MVDFIPLVLIFLGLNLALNFLRKKFIPGIYGADFLFFAPWVAASNFGLLEGLVTAAVILTVHIVMSLQIAHYILFAIPAVLLAVYLGNLWQFEGFWPVLILYHLVSSITTFVSRGFGGKFLIFILFSLGFNVVIYYLYTSLT